MIASHNKLFLKSQILDAKETVGLVEKIVCFADLGFGMTSNDFDELIFSYMD